VNTAASLYNYKLYEKVAVFMKKRLLLISLITTMLFTGCSTIDYHTNKITPTPPDYSKATDQNNNSNESKTPQEQSSNSNNESKNPQEQEQSNLNVSANTKKSIDEKVTAVLKQYIAALNEQDAYKAINLIDPSREDYDSHYNLMNMIFNESNMKYSLISKGSLNIINENKVSLPITIQVDNDPRAKSSKNVKDTVVFKKVHNEWKIEEDNFIS
jgi:DNA-binding protein Fis